MNTQTQLNQGNYNGHWTRRMDYDMTDTCNFKVNGFTYKYTVVKLVNTLKLSSDSANLCLDIHQG